MCKVSELKKSERRLVIHLKNGEKIYSDWYEDDDTNRMPGAVNCTRMECEVYRELKKNNGLTDRDIKEFYISRKREGDTVYISDHAMERLKERNGWNKKTALRMIKKVYDNGTPAGDVKGYLVPWIKNKVQTSLRGDTYILYGLNLYVFNKNTLVTVLNVPNRANVFGN